MAQKNVAAHRNRRRCVDAAHRTRHYYVDHSVAGPICPLVMVSEATGSVAGSFFVAVLPLLLWLLSNHFSNDDIREERKWKK